MLLKNEDSHAKMMFRCKNNITPHSFFFFYLIRDLFVNLHNDINLNNYLIEVNDFIESKT